MRKITNELDRRIPITIKKALVVEAQSLGFDTIDAYIQYLKAYLNDCEKQKKDFMQVIEAYSQKDKEAKKEPDLIKPEWENMQGIDDFFDDIEEIEKYTEELKQYIENIIEKYERAKSEASKEKIRKKVHNLLVRLPFDL